MVYVNKTTLFAVPFDVTTLDTRGAAVPIVDDGVLVVTPVEAADATKAEHHVVFLQNFFDELRRKVPLGK